MRLALLAGLLVPISSAAPAQRAGPFAENGDFAVVAAVPALNVLALEPALGGVGVHYRVADRTVIGASVDLQYATDEQDVNGAAGTFERRRLSVTVWNENHVGRRRGVMSPFLGAGVTFRAGDEDAEQDNPGCDPSAPCPPDQPASYRRTTSETAFGAGALLGAEVRPARGVTLGAAYVLGVEVARTRGDLTVPGQPDQEFSNTVVRVGTGTSDLHVSVYF